MPRELVWKINGQVVTKAEWERRGREHKRIFGDRCAEMLDKQQPCSIRTNDTFMRGKKDQNCDQGLDPHMLASHRDLAAKRGVSLSGKHWFGQLANHPLDLEGWCGSDAEVLAKARKERILVELNGVVHDFREKYRDVPDDTPYRVDDELVTKRADAAANELGELTPAERTQLKEDIRREMTPANL